MPFSMVKKLEMNDEIYSLIADHAADVIWIMDMDLNYIYLSPSVEKITGYTPEEFMAKPLYEVMPPYSLELCMNTLAEELEKDKKGEDHSRSIILDVQHICKDGSKVWTEMRVTFIRDKDGRASGLLGLGRDVTEKKLTEKALMESERKYHQLFDTESDALFLVERETLRLLDANSAAVAMYGYERGELLKMRAPDISAEPDKTSDAIHGAIEKVSIRWHKKKDGTVFPVETTGSYFLLNDIPVTLAAVRDISARLQIEHELNEHRERLEEIISERTAELANKTKSLEELNSALKVLLKQREEDRKELEERIVANVRNLIFPYLAEVKTNNLDARQLSYLNIIEQNLDEIISPMMSRVQHYNLTATESHIASLIKIGKTTKEIANFLGVATSSVDTHRKNIRKKLGLKVKRDNLQQKLRHLSS